MIQDFINKQYYTIFILTYLFGLVLYSVIGFDGTDEVCALLLLILFLFGIFKSPKWTVDKSFTAAVGVFLFYIGYSLYIQSNSTAGILKDVIIQFKPYLAFFGAYYLRPQFTQSQKKLLKDVACVVWGLMLLIGIASIVNESILRYTVGFAYYAGIITATALIYLYCSDGNKIDKVIFLILLAAGLLSFRSKFYGFFVLAIAVTLFIKNLSQLRFNVKTLLILALGLASMLVVGREKITLYFGSGNLKDVPESLAARSVLYITSIELLTDYFPFGTGFATYGTHASGEYYSSVYGKYHIENIKGMTKRNYSYIADTYYPSLAQFGVVGVVFYFGFFIFLLRKSMLLYRQTKEDKHFIIPFLIIGYLLLENVADATFTSSRGLFIMMFLGAILAEKRESLYPNTSKKEIQP